MHMECRGRIFLLLTSIVMMILSGCGGGGGDAGSVVAKVTPSIGYFGYSSTILVSGLDYQSASTSGRTKADGEFTYIPGEVISFSVGGIELGTVTAKANITLLDFDDVPLTSETDLTPSDKITNIARFLLSVDANRMAYMERYYSTLNSEIRIFITAASAATELSVNFTQSTVAFEQDPQVISAIETITSSIDPDSKPELLISAQYAQWHFAQTLSKIYGTKVDWTNYLAHEDGRQWLYTHSVTDSLGQVTTSSANRYLHDISFRDDPLHVQGTSINGGTNEYTYYDANIENGLSLIAYQPSGSNVDVIFSYPIDLLGENLVYSKQIPAIAVVNATVVHGKQLAESNLNIDVLGVGYSNVISITFTSSDNSLEIVTWYAPSIGMVRQVVTTAQTKTEFNLQYREIINSFPLDTLAEKNISNNLIRDYMVLNHKIIKADMGGTYFIYQIFIQPYKTDEEVIDFYRNVYTSAISLYLVALSSEISLISETYKIDSDYVISLMMADYIVYYVDLYLWTILLGIDSSQINNMIINDLNNMYKASIATMVITGVLF